MKEVKMYKSDDGRLYKNAKDASKRDEVVKETKKVLGLLGGEKKDPGCRFANGEGYFQLTKENVEWFDHEFLQLVKKHEAWIFKNYLTKAGKSDSELIRSHVLIRCLGDNSSPLYSALSIRLCVDNQHRRWGQPYFATNPNEGKQVKL